MSGGEVDVEGLVADLQREAAALRASLGPSALPPEENREGALRSVRAGAAPGTLGGFGRLVEASRLAGLGALADPGDVDFQSHRVRLGRAVIVAKQVLRRLLTPVLDRQGAFNRATVQAFSALEEELGQRLQAIERRLIALEEAVASPASGDTVSAVSFDYGAFEDRFRGDRAHVRAQLQRYATYFPTTGSGPVVDLGSGRGEFLELLGEVGVPAWGVEADERRAAECRRRGLDVRTGDVLQVLEAVDDASLGGVVSFQVVEHLTLGKTVRLLAVARRKLRPGGCCIVETVNVQSLITFTRAWTIDPSHRQPVHPLTLRFLVEQAGFARSELVYGSEVEPGTALEPGWLLRSRRAERRSLERPALRAAGLCGCGLGIGAAARTASPSWFRRCSVATRPATTPSECATRSPAPASRCDCSPRAAIAPSASARRSMRVRICATERRRSFTRARSGTTVCRSSSVPRACASHATTTSRPRSSSQGSATSSWRPRASGWSSAHGWRTIRRSPGSQPPQ